VIIDECQTMDKIDIHHPGVPAWISGTGGAVNFSFFLYTERHMNTKTRGFEEVAHTADLEIKAWGQDLNDLFVSSVEGMFHLSGVEDYEEGFSDITETISLEAMDYEGLLILFLEELLYRLTEDYMLFKVQRLNISDKFTLKAKLRGTQIKSYQRDIKAVTYHRLNIRETEDGYIVNIVFDI
jgi:SHS2 domain-containing protein